ncbi:MAG: DUF2167 domain-containing protein [Castellaniella sp.]|uniref:DUF2167 domain-containing protein n=1 Tax=Castellaniella sp. TaxID=1955812 RepID=UPI003A890346
MKQKISKFTAGIFAILLSLPSLAPAQQDENQLSQELAKLAWQEGPSKGAIGTMASIEVPKGYVFLDSANTSKFLALNGNLPEDNNYTLAPKDLNWFSVLNFDKIGYITDDDKIDADALLKELKEDDIESNKQRRKLNLDALHTVGWASPPHYDIDTKRLEWGIILRSSDGSENVNYTSRILGRTGVMNVTLVTDAEAMDQDAKELKKVLAGFTYNAGETYAEFKEGDKVAGYGLAALIVGGAAAVATKKGFMAIIGGALAAFWKIIVGVIAAGFFGLMKIFKKKK